MLGIAKRSGLGLAATDVFPSNTQFSVRFQGKSTDGGVNRPSHMTWAQIMDHQVRAVRWVPPSGVVTGYWIVEVTDKWRILTPATTRHLYDAIRPLYVAGGYGPVDFQVSVLYGARPIPVTPATPTAPPSDETRALASTVVSDLRVNGARYNRDTMRAFQRAAGIAVDGIYGDQTRAALVRLLPASNVPPSVESIRRQESDADPLRPPVVAPGTPTPVGDTARRSSGAGPWIAAAIMLALVGGAAWVVTR